MPDYTKRQKQIVEAAIELIAQGGIQTLTIKNVAARIGVSEPAIYRHFESKQDLLVAIQDLFADEKRAFYASINKSSLSAADKIARILDHHFTTFAAKPALAAVLFSEEIFQNDERLAAKVLDIMQNSRLVLLNIVKQGQAAGELRRNIPQEHIVTLVMGSLRLIVQRWHLQKRKFDLVHEGRLFLDSLQKVITNQS